MTRTKLLKSSASHLALMAGLAVSITSFAAVAQEPKPAVPQSEAEADGATVTAPINVQGNTEGDYKVDDLSSAKQTAPILDTPQTVTVVPQEVIREQAARNLTEVLKSTPGISFNGGENGFGTSANNFSLRGFDTSGSVFIDGARDSGSYTRDVFNVEQVEVFKGPAADNGRGGAGGYVNIVTKSPQLDDFIAGTVSYGFDEYDSEDRKRATVDVNQRIGQNSAIRINALMEDSGIPGREIAEQKAWGIAPSLAFGLGTEFRAIFSYEHVERNDLPEWGVPGAAYSDMNANNPDGQAAFDPALAGMSRDAFFGLSSDFDDVDSDAVIARFEYDLAPTATLSNQTRWSVTDRTARYTLPTGNAGGGVINTQTQFYDRENTSLSNLTDLSLRFTTGMLRHHVSAGIELTKEESEATRFGAVNSTTSAFNPDPNRAPGAPFVPASTADVEVKTIAAYAYDTMEIDPKWQVTGGVRAERYEVEIVSSDASIAGGNTYDDSETLLGGKIGLVHKPVSNGSVYVSFGMSEQPYGSFLSNPDISRTGANAFPGFVPGAKPITAYNYEVGTKWDLFGDRLLATAALFRTEKKDVAFSSGGALLGYGQQIVQGLELGATGKLTEEWNVFGGLLLMDSERKHDPAFDAVLRAANPGDYGTATTTNGDELAFTPNVSASLWTTYRLPVGLTFGGGMRYVGSSYLGRPDDALRVIANSRYGEVPSYTVFDAMVSYEVTESIDLRLNVENLTDRTYISSSNWNGRRVMLGNPRTFIVSTSFKF
ncbi:TonB-dependent siderophore receptor [Parvibaculum lavamentivorans DS-1]|uniref:TonB-dependent siderophore receptor n=1 Tax=Parvibaculum lavamentivorans (strain DS-1 / DSM 13023 / NCIMB 13966) TaxID=402881 RepID=A7HQ16_PARL1|nr:TonB-dependent siderophore receptor [Parvibaculum lavamentivorans]ABS61999.1 TonB-dependent siderophore receptor [Parvibaculum lavamentivorans DS-1]